MKKFFLSKLVKPYTRYCSVFFGFRVKRMMMTVYSQLKERILNLLAKCPVASMVLAVAKKERQQVYLVGGFLRDFFLGQDSRDMDFVSPAAGDLANSVALQEEIKAVPIDRKFGTVRFIHRMKDRQTDDFCQVDLSPLRDGSIEGDLRQRDFTVNAVAVEISGLLEDRDVEVVDPLGGLLDLQAGRLRCCSENSLRDDPLRILRAYRLVSIYGLTLEHRTREQIIEARSGLNNIAVERIRDELAQILSVENSVSVLTRLGEDNVLWTLLPECIPMWHGEQKQLYDQNVWQHSLSTLKTLEFFLTHPEKLLGRYAGELLAVLSQRIAADRTRRIALKLAVLLHDLGKPSSILVDEDGGIHYQAYQVKGARLTASLCSRLRFSKNEIQHISLLVRQHTRPAYLFRVKKTPTKALARFFGLGPEVFWPLLSLFAANYSAKQGFKDVLGPLRQRLCGWLDFYTVHLKPREQERPLVDGHDLMTCYDLEAGPTVGRLLKVLGELHWEGEITTREEALECAARLLEQWGISTPDDR
jgi:poly(A) polymerase